MSPDPQRRGGHSHQQCKSPSAQVKHETLFSSLTQARAAITAWKENYNRNRPHSSLGNITPSEFAMKMTMEKQAA